MHTSSERKIPRGCFAVPHWNGEVVVFDPRAKLEPLCCVLVYKKDDLRIRTVGIYTPRRGQTRLVRIRVVESENQERILEFWRDLVTIAKIVDVYRPVSAESLAAFVGRQGKRML